MRLTIAPASTATGFTLQYTIFKSGLIINKHHNSQLLQKNMFYGVYYGYLMIRL